MYKRILSAGIKKRRGVYNKEDRQMSSKNYCIGVDLGGTNIAVGLVDLDSRKIVKQVSTKTNAPRSGEAICADIAALCRSLCSAEKIKMTDVLWVGAVTPGTIKDGIVTSACNLGWKNVNFTKILASAVRRPVYIANDANGAAYAEAVWGSGEGASSLVALTIGTGVGGGIVFDGVMWVGANGFAAELGHITVDVGEGTCQCDPTRSPASDSATAPREACAWQAAQRSRR